MADIYVFLKEHGILYKKCEHEAVFTCEEALQKVPPMPGAHTKNLFLRDRNARRHLLVVVGYEKSVDLKALCDVVDADKLSFASPDRLKDHLGVEPGSVTLLAVVNDERHAVEVFIDRPLWDSEGLLCHPLVNTATLSIPHEGIEKFLKATGHDAKIIDVPSRA
jgi:Ala-tRNA(Pro) deacylase